MGTGMVRSILGREWIQIVGAIDKDSFNTMNKHESKIGKDTVIYPSVILEGETVIGSHCTIYPGVHVVDTRVGNRVRLFSSSMIEQSVIHDEARVGPFTHLRPKTIIRQGAKVGNFVEMKNTVFGQYSKAGHLSYLGDTEVKDAVNIGAGTITCNYDGIKKSKTHIESGAFIGSGVMLVAPIKIWDFIQWESGDADCPFHPPPVPSAQPSGSAWGWS